MDYPVLFCCPTCGGYHEGSSATCPNPPTRLHHGSDIRAELAAIRVALERIAVALENQR